MSAPSASWKPPPNATPWIAAITGTGSCRQPHTACCGKFASPWVRADRSRFSPPAIPLPPLSFIAAKRPMSRPAQNARPSPDNTTARTPFSWASRSVAATSASNIAASSAFILSARTSRTSAMPSEIDIETRCSMRILLHCFLCCRFTERRWPDLVNRPINRQFPWVETMFNDQLLAGRRILVTGGGTGLGKSMAARFLAARRRGPYLRPPQDRVRRDRDRTDGPAWRARGQPRRRHPQRAWPSTR